MNIFDTQLVVPNHLALEVISQGIWDFTQKTNQRPLVVLTTAGPAISLRGQIELNRPKNLSSNLVFLPEIQGLNQWLEGAPQLLSFPQKSMLERWAEVYGSLEDWPEIRKHLGALGEGGKWMLAQSIVAACDKLSESSLLSRVDSFDQQNNLLFKKEAEKLFSEAMDAAYPELAQQMLSLDGRLILAFWKNLSTVHDPNIRRHFAFKARLELADRPLVWIELAQIFGQQNRVHQEFLSSYAEKFPVLKYEMDWEQGALWSEALPNSVDPKTGLLSTNSELRETQKPGSYRELINRRSEYRRSRG